MDGDDDKIEKLVKRKRWKYTIEILSKFLLASILTISIFILFSFIINWLFEDQLNPSWTIRSYARYKKAPLSFFNPLSLYHSEVPLSQKDENYILFDHHTHTLHSDGKMSVSELIKWATYYGGYDAIAITDHNTFKGGIEGRKCARKNPDLITVVAGMEYSSCSAHMNILIPPTIRDDTLVEFEVKERDHGILAVKSPTVVQLLEFVSRIHEELPGALVIVNHYWWSEKLERSESYEKTLPTHPLVEDFISKIKVDGFEVINGAIFDVSLLSQIINRSLILLAGSDVHYPVAPSCWTALVPPPDAGSLDKEALLWASLLNSRGNPILSLHPEGNAPLPQVNDGIFRQLIDPFVFLSTLISSTFVVIDNGMYSFIKGTISVTYWRR